MRNGSAVFGISVKKKDCGTQLQYSYNNHKATIEDAIDVPWHDADSFWAAEEPNPTERGRRGQFGDGGDGGD